jgi:hypothetical protein
MEASPRPKLKIPQLKLGVLPERKRRLAPPSRRLNAKIPQLKLGVLPEFLHSLCVGGIWEPDDVAAV